MHKPESVLENETHKILWDLEVQTDHQIPASRPCEMIINKKREPAEYYFAVLWEHWVKMKENEIRDNYQDLTK